MRKWKLYGAIAGLVLLVSAAVWLLAWRNSSYLYLECREDRVIALRGASWPWGRRKLGGAAYRPIKIPPEADCRDRTFTKQVELERALVEFLIDRAQVGLKSKKLDDVAEAKLQLDQALLLSRSWSERRALIQRLGGDLAYREGGQAVGDAQKGIAAAIQHFKEALERQPVHFHDADLWIKHLEAASQALEEGPRPVEQIAEAAGQPAPPPGTETRSSQRSRDNVPAVRVEIDAAVPEAPKPDAGLPAGGVLL